MARRDRNAAEIGRSPALPSNVQAGHVDGPGGGGAGPRGVRGVDAGGRRPGLTTTEFGGVPAARGTGHFGDIALGAPLSPLSPWRAVPTAARRAARRRRSGATGAAAPRR